MMLVVLKGALILFIFMSLVWFIAKQIKNPTIVDVAWSLGFLILTSYYVYQGRGWDLRKSFILVMVFLWSVRLSGHLFFNRILKGHVDGRYLALEQSFTKNIWQKYFYFFQGQALLIIFMSAPFILVSNNASEGFSIWESFGILLFAIGWTGETIADYQLQQFKNNPQNKGRVCREGFWQSSRHPNYFFEFVIWLGFFMFSIPADNGWVAAVSPAILLFLLYRVTGIPATEAQALRTKGDLYREYQSETYEFIVWFPKKKVLNESKT